MIRRPVVHLALIVLSFASVVLALSELEGGSLGYWYLFCSPLLLAAYFFGLRGTLVLGAVTVATLVQLYRNALLGYQALLATAEQVPGLLDGLTPLSKNNPSDQYPHVLAGALLMIAGAIVIGFLYDQKRLQDQQIALLKSHDSLTGLPTRQFFINALRQWSEESVQGQEPLTVLVFDLDNFKALQNQYGHFSGDRVLERVGKDLAGFRDKDSMVARLGSDEFGLASRSQIPAGSRAKIEALRAKVGTCDWTGAKHDGSAQPVTASFGVARMPWDGRSSGELLKNAWWALEQQRADGGNGIRFASLIPELDHPPTLSPPNTLEEWREVFSRLPPVAEL